MALVLFAYALGLVSLAVLAARGAFVLAREHARD
jgi:hypothetical protein